MLRSALALLLALSPAEGLLPQEDAARPALSSAEGLIEKLEDDSFEVRDRAQKDLVKLGDAAVPALKKILDQARDSADRGELILRANAALREIELAAKSKSVCPDAPLFDFKLEVPLGDLADRLQDATKVPIDCGAPGRALPVKSVAERAPLMKVLDDLCRGREDLAWEWSDGRALFKVEPFAARPSAYAGAFRVRLASLRMTRSTDFKARTVSLIAGLEADHDPTVKPSKDRELEIVRATDDKGTMLEVRSGEELDEGQQQIFARGRFNRFVVRGGAPAPSAPATFFTIRGLPPDARKITLSGQARYRFPLDRSDVKLENPQGGETRELGDYTARLDAAGNRRWMLSFRKTKGSTSPQSFDELQRRLEADSAVAIDEDGAEHKGTLNASPDTLAANIVIVNGQVQETVEGLGFLFQFPTLKNKGIKELRFRFADKLFEKVVPFTLENVELP